MTRDRPYVPPHYAIEILERRLGATWILRNRRIDIEYDAALAAVEALLEAATPVAAKLIEGSWRRDGVVITKAEAEALAVAVRRVETGQ